MRILLLLLFLPLAALSAQSDSLLRAAHWEEVGTDRRLLLTPDGTFQLDYGPDAGDGRYLMGRYRTGEDNRELTLSVDYFLGKRRIPARYRQGQDFHLVYVLENVGPEELVLRDVLTRDTLRFTAGPLEAEDDPARRRIKRQMPGKLELPPGWGG